MAERVHYCPACRLPLDWRDGGLRKNDVGKVERVHSRCSDGHEHAEAAQAIPTEVRRG